MLEGLRSWAMMISGVVVFGSLCEVILPDGAFQKYIRLTVGLMLVFALISPFANVFKENVWEIEEEIGGRKAFLQREKMEDNQKAEVMRIYRHNLSVQIKKKIVSELGVICDEIDCEVEENEEEFGRIKKVTILIENEGGEDMTEQIKAVLEKSFGVEPSVAELELLMPYTC